MNREELIASLQFTTEDRNGVYFGPDNDPDDNYFDWSSPLRNAEGHEIGRSVEVGDGQEAVVLELGWPEIERLQRALTLLLLERDA